MLMILFVLFVCIPLMELALLIRMGTWIGFWPTILVQVVTGALGASLAKFQGLLVWVKIQEELRQGRVPAEEALDGVLILAAGLVLLTPGLLTDAAGFLLLIPITRYWFKRWLRRRFDRYIQNHPPTGIGSWS